MIKVGDVYKYFTMYYRIENVGGLIVLYTTRKGYDRYDKTGSWTLDKAIREISLMKKVKGGKG